MVILKNKLRRMRVFNLDSRFHTARRDSTPPGKPETLTLFALERREVEDAVRACTEIKAALGASPQTLRVYEQPEPKAAEKKSKPSKPPARKTAVRTRGSEG